MLQTLGKVKLLEGDYDHAEEYIKRAEEIFHMSGHPDIYTSFETLSELYQKKANSLEKEAKIEEAKLLYTKASNELKKVLTVLEANFPPDSPHIKRYPGKT